MTPDHHSLLEEYQTSRRISLGLCEPLLTEDYIIQPIADASPPKWHLAHVTWFYETFLLKVYLKAYETFNPVFETLFNSYYNGVGDQFPRHKRGTLSRPSVDEVMAYRRHVDSAMQGLMADPLDDELVFRIKLGINHEQQHQELLCTDIKYNLGHNPLFPIYQEMLERPSSEASRITSLSFEQIEGGVYEIGSAAPSAQHFVFDNETPRHRVLVETFQLADRLVSNGEYLAFIEAGAYSRFDLWLSDAWALINSTEGFSQPLYWRKIDGRWFEYSLLGGLKPLDLDQPVCHVSAYEADAFARWSGARLPTEAEWELAQGQSKPTLTHKSGVSFEPAAPSPQSEGLRQMTGEVWQWTSSSYGAYPGFTPFPGQLGEYNGKFMANQLVLRGSSCVTPIGHSRNTYRNFFYPKDRWQFSGIRLAKDV